MRRILIVLHRYTGLTIAIFLVVAGLTGALLPFYHELDAALNPSLHRVDTVPDAPPLPLDPILLREKIAAELPGRDVDWIPLDVTEGHALTVWAESDDPAADDEFFVDPYSGSILGSRKWGEIGQGLRLNGIPFLYKLHYTLGLGETGSLLFGIAALLWTIDCFVGAALTFPVGGNRQGDEGAWARRWRVSWLIKGGTLFRSIFTFHRAAGLWLWVMLFVFAWSAVGFNLRPVFNPIMKGLFGLSDVRESLPTLAEPRTQPELDWREALDTARITMARLAEERGFAFEKEAYIEHNADKGAYRYAVHTSLDAGKRWPGTRLWLDSNTGTVLGLETPTGGPAGNTVSSWLFALHTANAGGMPYRVFVSILGVAITGLTVSGIYLWGRKALRQQAATAKERSPIPPTAGQAEVASASPANFSL